ncbi:hypothetical protein L218DRAFT_993689 [Marasmius fiardii PR-910]|nr:hypothetical protein L218DRAFT_993689 [Marasmius fiardii PR-910]
MNFDPFEVSIPHIIYACLGGFIVLFGMFSLFLREKLYVGEACWAFVFGVIIGPYGANIFNPRGWGGGKEDVTNEITLEITRIVLAIGVFGIGVELPKAYMRKHWKSLLFLLGPIMTWGWFVSAAFIFALVPGLNFLSSLAVAACLTPTDPILAQAVVGGKYADKHVPAHLRHLLAAESGCNDGAAFPFLYIALYLIIEHNTGRAVRDWFLLLWLYQVVLGIVIGAAVGIGFRYLMKYCQKWDLIDRHSYVAQYVSLALFTVGVTVLLGSDDLLSTFACGTAFAWDGFFNRQTEEAVFSSVIDLLFNIACFVFVGAWMPFSSFEDAELTLSVWRLVVIAILVLLFRRLPVVIALYKWIPDIKTFREAVFSGHFGPMGIGAIFISTLASEVLHEDAAHNEQTDLLVKAIQPIVAFMVLCSILIHGLSIPSFSLGRRVHSVTRTWSRHTTIGGTQQAPDWTNQARMVTNRDEIVINRDENADANVGDVVDSMEKGELRSMSAGSSEDEKKGTQKNARRRSPAEGEVLPEGEAPPDGEEIVSEWQEGPHRIIERRKGPGEEVEVEVIRDYGSPEAHSTLFRGTHQLTRENLNTSLNKLKHLVEAEEHEAVVKKKTIEKEVEQLEDKAKDAIVPSSSKRRDPPKVVIDDSAVNDEEGWAYEDDPPPLGVASRMVRSESVSNRKKAKGMGRRRGSKRRGIKGIVAAGSKHLQHSHPRSSAVVEKAVDGPGRSHSPVRRASRNGLRDMRLDRIRSRHEAREESPTHSIRWMDEGVSPGGGNGRTSGTSTPRYSSIFHHGSPMVGSRPSTPPYENQ